MSDPVMSTSDMAAVDMSLAALVFNRSVLKMRPAGFEPATFRSGGERSIP